jgi:hypothetical protein
MSAAESGDERLVGVRVQFDEIPPAVRSWTEEVLGAPVVAAQPRVGGMSPAMAASLLAENGRTMFVKAVGSEINPDTPTHFRHEIEVLSALPPAPYRLPLLSSYDDGGWVGIALDDVDGRHPDWTSAHERQRILALVVEQSRELTPCPSDTPEASVAVACDKYAASMTDASAEERAVLPGWAAERLDELTGLCERMRGRLTYDTFCHFDVRYDNLLVRRTDNQPLLVDWGMSRRGPRWLDVVVFGFEWVDSPVFDGIVDALDLSPAEQRDVTGFLAGAGCYLVMQTAHPAPLGLPTINAFRRRVGLAMLGGVRRRLSL